MLSDDFYFSRTNGRIIDIKILIPTAPPYNRTARYSFTASGFFMPVIKISFLVKADPAKDT